MNRSAEAADCRLAGSCKSGYQIEEGDGSATLPRAKRSKRFVMKIFLSYRRDDTQHSTGRLYERLVRVFGRNNVFKDVDSIPPGADFRDLLVQRVSNASVMLAVIGANWQAKDDQNRSRLENSGDFVRIELEDAMQRNIPVIPVLVDGAKLPLADHLPESLRALTFRQAVVLRADPDFSSDAERIIRHLQGELPNGGTGISRTARLTAGIVTVIAAVAVIFLVAYFTREMWLPNSQPLENKPADSGTGKVEPSVEPPGFELGRQFKVTVSVDDLVVTEETRTREVTDSDGTKRPIQETVKVPVKVTREIEIVSDIWPKVSEVTREGERYYKVETIHGTQEQTTYSRRAPEIRPLNPYGDSFGPPPVAPAPPADDVPAPPPISP
jgi:hypothetical protein